MWRRWKQKIKNMFREEDRVPKEKITLNRDLPIKVTYQYPKERKFKFPVIPDEYTPTETTEFAHEKHRHSLNKTKREQPLHNLTNADLENVPAYIRRQRNVPINRVNQDDRKQSRIDENENSHSIIDHVKKTNEAARRIAERKRKRELEKRNQHDKQVVPQPKKEQIQHDFTEINKVRKKDSVRNTDRAVSIHTEQINKRNESIIHNEQSISQSSQRYSRQNMQHEYENQPKAQDNLQSLVKSQTNKHLKEWSKINHSKNHIPPLDLLKDQESAPLNDHHWIERKKHLLEQTFEHFNVQAKVVKTTKGPSVTRYEVQPALGVKVSRIKNLSDDIKLNIAAKDIRMEAPIPGKHTIGIEVPNEFTQTVGLKEILRSDVFKKKTSPLSVVLGLTIEGNPLITDIHAMPHGLIAGATGSGKSVCINTILISLIYKAHYEEVKLLLIDPKMVELAPYNGIPHLAAPVITDVKEATQALKWAVAEMERRYESFARIGVRDLKRYNEKVEQGEKLPSIVIVIDELADLMMVSPQDVEDCICRLAQKARACGIHLLLATQRPSVDVITGLIKANIPTRIAFSVSSHVDSRTIIDSNGAEKLLGKGDMLFIENGSGKAIRLQGPFVSDEEIEKVTNYMRSIAPENYLFQKEDLKNEEMSHVYSEDGLIDQVMQFVVEHNQASTSLLQRNFRIGYNRAARLMDDLERKGVISSQNGTKPREVLLSKSEIENLVRSE